MHYITENTEKHNLSISKVVYTYRKNSDFISHDKANREVPDRKIIRFLTVTVRDDYTPMVRGASLLPRHFIMAFSMLSG